MNGSSWASVLYTIYNIYFSYSMNRIIIQHGKDVNPRKRRRVQHPEKGHDICKHIASILQDFKVKWAWDGENGGLFCIQHI